jgi:hypothetical protein
MTFCARPNINIQSRAERQAPENDAEYKVTSRLFCAVAVTKAGPMPRIYGQNLVESASCGSIILDGCVLLR